MCSYIKQGIVFQVNLTARLYLPVSFVLMKKEKKRKGGREREREHVKEGVGEILRFC